MPWQRGLVVLSADPITFGHLDLIDQALSHSEEVVVLVTINIEKLDSYLFPLEERGEMASRAISERFGDDKRLQFLCGRYRAMDVYRVYHCDVMIRGLRHERERAYEEEVLAEFREEAPELATLLLPARAEFAPISSTEVKRIAIEDPARLIECVPVFVAERLMQRLNHQENAHAHR